MLYRIVRPVKRKGTSHAYFVQRIPADVKARAAGLKLTVPVGSQTVPLNISPKAADIRVSLRTREPSEAKVRQATVAAYLENVWRALRQDKATSLSHRQATALAGELYRAWADEQRGRTLAIVHNPATGLWEHADGDTGVRPTRVSKRRPTSELWTALARLRPSRPQGSRLHAALQRH